MSIRACVAVIIQASVLGCQAETFTSSGPTGLEVLHGPPPLVSLGTELDTLLVVRVVDEAGNPVPGVAVNWQIVDGDGELIPAAPISDADGLASARWKFGMIPGLKRAQVSVEGLDPVTLSTEAVGFRAVQVTAGWDFGCGLDGDQVPWCWGGDGVERGSTTATTSRLRPTPVDGGHHFAEVQSGNDFTCGRTGSGEAWCWGYNWVHVVSQGDVLEIRSPLQIPGLPSLMRLRTGGRHSCGLAADSTAWCWGANDALQAGGTGSSIPPTQLATPLRFVDLALGFSHSCGLTSAGSTYCWGENGSGQLGDSGANRNAPATAVQGGHSFVEIKAGDDNTCGRTSTGEVWCWGRSDGANYGRDPVKLSVPPALAISVGSGYLAIATLGGTVTFAPDDFGLYTLPREISAQGVGQLDGRASFCLVGRGGDVYCSGYITGEPCSSLPPFGCGAPTGPIPLPAGGRVYGYPPFGD
jgi:hypothetical protein